MSRLCSITGAFLAAFLMLGMIWISPFPAAADPADTTYKIYPIPKEVSYGEDTWVLKDFNAVLDNEVDDATRARLKEVADLKGFSVTESESQSPSKTNIIVGVIGSDGPGRTAIGQKIATDDAIFDGNDAYQIVVEPGNIYVLGKDADAAFYGLTTLYHVVKQLDSKTIRNFTVKDSADVVSRGFIEGYYGNPWSLEDRINLMEWGGYYKLNSYFYAPKDDPKHNAKWRELYTQEELNTLIKPLADAGNRSKTRFVYALHPLMNNPINFGANYDRDLKILQDKFEQVLSVGVRQIAILADDAAFAGQANTLRLLTDMTAWLEEQQATYPDLKLTLPYVVQEYMGYGQAYFNQFPENVQIVMTGGRVWGEVSQDFTQRFTATAGRGPYLWINWPCTDNSKQHLIMGGYSTFLHPNVDPSSIEGIVLNPMQQSEPSKVAIFGNAAYSWNIWSSEEEADQAWRDSFSFVQNNSAVNTPASDALLELSKHQINQNMDNRVRELQESVELREHLNDLKAKIEAGTATSDDIAAIRAEFKILQDAARTFRAQGDPKLLGDLEDYSGRDANEQMAPWLDAWDDTTEAAIAYLDAVEAFINDDVSMMMSKLSQGQQAFAKSKTHGFFYVNHTEYAEVGVQHIVPFINFVEQYLSDQVRLTADPEALVLTYISDVFTKPTSGSIDDILDGDDGTVAEFRNPNYLYKDNYVGVMFSRPITLENARFAFGGGKNHFYAAKVQYTLDGEEWLDASSEVFERPRGNETPIEISDLNIADVTGVRLISTRDNGDDLWLNIKGIDVNRDAETKPYKIANISLENLVVAAYSLQNAIDGNLTTQVQLKTGNGQDYMEPGSAVVVDLGEARDIGKVVVHSGDSAAPGDRPTKAVVEVSDNGTDWEHFSNLDDETATGKANARYVRIRNTVHAPVWWRLREIEVFAPSTTDSNVAIYTNVEDTDLTVSEIDSGAQLSDGSIVLQPGEFVGIDLGNIRKLTQVNATADAGHTVLQLGNNEHVWREVENVEGETARYVRILNNGADAYTLDVQDFIVKYLEVGEFGRLVSSDIPVAAGWGDTREDGRGFDLDMTTVTKFGGNPRAGNTAVYDLGQPIDIESLRIYTPDSQTDYIRDARIQISLDGNEWEDAFEIGDRVTDTDRTTPFGSITDPNKRVDSNYPNVLYYGNDEVGGKTARYVRILITADYPTRAIVFNELMVNNGEYVSPEANAEFSSTVTETPGHNPSKMTDRDFSTYWRPSEGDGVLSKQVSENTAALRFVSAGQPSGATVKAQVIDPETNEVSEITLGTLDQPITDFLIPENLTMLAYSISWGSDIPQITEVIAISDAEPGDEAKAELRALADGTPEGFDSWTAEAMAEFEALQAAAQRVLASEHIAKASVESMTRSLQRAIENAPLQADPGLLGELRGLVDGALSNDKQYYTSATFTFYKNAVDAAAAAPEDAQSLTNDDLNELIGAINTAKDGLKYSVYHRELAQQVYADSEGFDEDDYTAESFQPFAEAREALAEALKSTEATPMELEKLAAALSEAQKNLEEAEPEPTETDSTESEGPTESETEEPTESEPTESESVDPSESEEPTESETAGPTETEPTQSEPTPTEPTEPSTSEPTTEPEEPTSESTESETSEPTPTDPTDPTDPSDPTESEETSTSDGSTEEPSDDGSTPSVPGDTSGSDSQSQPGTSGPGGGLPKTGVSVIAAGIVGAALLVLGGVFVTRRRLED
jgi:hyaluronoglucosaminidase